MILLVLAIVTFAKLSSIENPPNSGPNGAKSAGVEGGEGGLLYASDRKLPPNGKSLNINVIGRQYIWQFVYPGANEPDGLGAPYSYEEMVVPTNTTVTLNIESEDVVHSWWIPELGGKFQAVPGYHNYTWFKISKPGVYRGQCALLCGRGHARMIATVKAVPPAQFEAWLAYQKKLIAEANEDARKRARSSAKQTGAGQVGKPLGHQRKTESNGRHCARHRLHSVTAHHVEPEPRGWTSWITTTDHKRIGIMYMVTTFVFFCLGGVEALIMRLQLGAPNNTLVTPTTYNQLFTMHGTTMIFLFVVPMMAGLANYFVPLMIGARDMAFPRLNALSYWLLLAGGIVFYASVFWNPPEAGWVSFVPLANQVFSPSRRRGRLDLPDPPDRHLLDPRRDQLLRDDRQHARARHELGPPAAVHLDDPRLLGPDHLRDARDRRRR